MNTRASWRWSVRHWNHLPPATTSGSASTPSSVLTPPPNLPIWQPRLPLPEHYVREPGTCHSFLSQFSLAFELQPATFPTDRVRIACIITLLSPGTAVWGVSSSVCDSYPVFCAKMTHVCDCTRHVWKATCEMPQIQQGGGSVSDYGINFRTLTSSSCWSQDAQYAALLHGQLEEKKDELATLELPARFDALVILSIRIDRHWVARGWEQAELQRRMGESWSPFSPNWTAPVSATWELEPMPVDRTWFTLAECQRRIQTCSWMYSGNLGH